MLQTVNVMSYHSTIYVAVRHEDQQEAGPLAVRVFGDFLSRLKRNAHGVSNLRMELEEPVARKDDPGVYEVLASLRASVPDDLYLDGTDNSLDAWRGILRTQFNYACHDNHEIVFHTASRVSITRTILPGEDVEEAVDDTPAAPKEMIAVKVMLGGTEYNVEIPKGENLLDGVNDKDVDVKWDCKNGVCDTCKVHVLSGMENLSGITDNERTQLGDLVNQGWRLSCQVTASGPCHIKQ